MNYYTMATIDTFMLKSPIQSKAKAQTSSTALSTNIKITKTKLDEEEMGCTEDEPTEKTCKKRRQKKEKLTTKKRCRVETEDITSDVIVVEENKPSTSVEADCNKVDEGGSVSASETVEISYEEFCEKFAETPPQPKPDLCVIKTTWVELRQADQAVLPATLPIRPNVSDEDGETEETLPIEASVAKCPPSKDIRNFFSKASGPVFATKAPVVSRCLIKVIAEIHPEPREVTDDTKSPETTVVKTDGKISGGKSSRRNGRVGRRRTLPKVITDDDLVIECIESSVDDGIPAVKEKIQKPPVKKQVPVCTDEGSCADDSVILMEMPTPEDSKKTDGSRINLDSKTPTDYTNVNLLNSSQQVEQDAETNKSSSSLNVDNSSIILALDDENKEKNTLSSPNQLPTKMMNLKYVESSKSKKSKLSKKTDLSKKKKVPTATLR